MRDGWSALVVLGIPTLLVVAAVWWLETRFGAQMALMTVGGTIGIICFASGALFAYRLARNVLNVAADFVHEMEGSQKARLGVDRETAKTYREITKHSLKDDERSWRIAERRAKLLMDNQSDEPVETWSNYSNGDGNEDSGSLTFTEWD